MPIESSRVLHKGHPRLRYVPSTAAVNDLSTAPRKGLHYGQRKLLLSEIEFITLLTAENTSVDAAQDAHSSSSATAPQQQQRGGEANTMDKSLLIVYAGAANGSHLPLLFDLFPGVRYVLIDPAPFCHAVQTIAQLANGPIAELINGYCTDELCLRLRRQYGGSHRLALVSDIRSGIPEKLTNKQNTDMITRDNKMQASWCVSLCAEAAMLKFHPPYPAVTDRSSRHYDPQDNTPESIRYLDGQLVFGVWAPKSSSEVRLIITMPFRADAAEAAARAEGREYNCREFEEQLYHYNTHNRYQKDVDAERTILASYLKAATTTALKGKGGVDKAHSSVEKLSRSISAFLGFPLFTPLENGFSEDDARLVSLLYASRSDDALEAYETLRGKLTTNALISLVEGRFGIRRCPEGSAVAEGPGSWAEDAAGGAESDSMSIGDVKLPQDFWTSIATPRNLTEVYSLPTLRPPAKFSREKKPRT